MGGGEAGGGEAGGGGAGGRGESHRHLFLSSSLWLQHCSRRALFTFL